MRFLSSSRRDSARYIMGDTICAASLFDLSVSETKEGITVIHGNDWFQKRRQ